MAENVAWILYGIGFLSVATGPAQNLPMRDPLAKQIATAISAFLWPLGGLILLASRAAGRGPRHG